jgi:hypothetical protein
MGINYKGSQGETERAVVLQEEEDSYPSSNTTITMEGSWLLFLLMSMGETMSLNCGHQEACCSSSR